MKKFATPILISLLFVSPALAETVSGTVPANRSTALGSVSLFDKSGCAHGPVIRMSLKKVPKHGKVTFKRRAVKLSKGRCKGHTIKGTVVIYTPNRGYRGRDSFQSRFSYDKHVTGTLDQAYISTNFEIVVK